MPVLRGRAEHRAVLQLADDMLERFVALQGDVLSVLVAHAAQSSVQFLRGDARAAEAKAVEEKRATEEKKLYSGTVRNPKELTAMQEEVEMLVRQRARLDEKIVLLMGEVESAKQHQAVAKKALSAARAALKAKVAVAQTAAGEMSAIAQKLTAHREEALKKIPEPLLKRYEELKKANQGIGIAPVVDGNTCGGCRMGLPSQIVTRLRLGKDIETCLNCGRMLCEGDVKK